MDEMLEALKEYLEMLESDMQHNPALKNYYDDLKEIIVKYDEEKPESGY